MLNFSAVLPLPKASYATPNRGVMSLNESTPVVRGKLIGAGLKGDVSSVPLNSAGVKLHARSYRRAPCRVSRPRVHLSWMYNDAVPVRSAWCHSGRRHVN